MAHGDGRDSVQTVYGALMGGLIASMLGILVFGLFLNADGPVGNRAPLLAMFTGMASVIVFMIGGVLGPRRLVWLTHTLLFASGFTAMWTAALSIGAEPRWAVAAGYGVAIICGVGLGAWRFRGAERPVRPNGSEATWTH